jgi:thiol:disulfide interchange protein DsbA
MSQQTVTATRVLSKLPVLNQVQREGRVNMATKKTSSAKSTAGVERVRNLILGFVGLLVVGFVVTTFYLGTGLSQNSVPEAGSDYEVIADVTVANPVRRLTVEEYFSYACVHCKNFDPTLEDWLTTLPEDVNFNRVPTAFSRAWGVLAQGYFALEKANALDSHHQQMFKAIHNGGRVFSSGEAIADYLDSPDLPAADFMRAFDSRDVMRKLNRAEQATRRTGIEAVPTMVVAGKYRVGMDNGAERALQVVDYLLEQERVLMQGEAP